MESLPEVLTLAAEQARARATRRATTLPVVLKMAATALATELTMRADDDEAVLRALGLPTHSPLRPLAKRLPSAAERAAGLITAVDQRTADALAAVADLTHRGSGASPRESDASSDYA